MLKIISDSHIKAKDLIKVKHQSQRSYQSHTLKQKIKSELHTIKSDVHIIPDSQIKIKMKDQIRLAPQNLKFNQSQIKLIHQSQSSDQNHTSKQKILSDSHIKVKMKAK